MRTPLSILVLSCSLSLAAQAPSVSSGGIVNGASFSALVTAGSVGVVFGSNLAPSGTSANASGQSTWPISLGGTSIQMNGIAAPLAFVSQTQINFQVPWELA